MIRKEDYLEEFNKVMYLKIDEYIRTLHLLYDKRSDLVKKVNEYKDYFKNNNIEIKHINNIDNLTKIIIPFKGLRNLQIGFAHSYNYTVQRIRHLENQIEVINNYTEMPYTIASYLQDILNVEIVNFLLRGNTYSFGSRLGQVRVKNVINKYNKYKVSWNETRKLKNKLIAEGKEVYSEDNPDGIKYFIYRANDDYSFFQWKKAMSAVINTQYYRFAVCSKFNVPYDNLTDLSVEGILNNKKLAALDKLVYLQRTYPDYKENFRHERK